MVYLWEIDIINSVLFYHFIICLCSIYFSALAFELIEAGFEYVTERNGVKIYRKPK